jgi:cyanophycinase
VLVEAAAGRPAYVLPTAAARQDPARAVRTAAAWFFTLGCAVQELPVLTRSDAQSPALAERVADAGLVYLVGGDPGHLLATLEGSAVWQAIEAAWRDGAALAGSSAGAMVLAEYVLLRAKWPNHHRRRPVPGLGLVPGVAVVPHYDGGGARWTTEAPLPLLGLDERTAAVWTEQTGWQALGPGRVVGIEMLSSPRT